MQILDLTLPCLYVFVICPHIHGPSAAWRTHLLLWADNLSPFIYEILRDQVLYTIPFGEGIKGENTQGRVYCTIISFLKTEVRTKD